MVPITVRQEVATLAVEYPIRSIMRGKSQQHHQSNQVAQAYPQLDSTAIMCASKLLQVQQVSGNVVSRRTHYVVHIGLLRNYGVTPSQYRLLHP